MEIISHRGYWKTKEEKNIEKAFIRSFSLGFGTETDLRDYRGEIVISHDIATENCISFEHFLILYLEYNPKLTLAFNIKADGLQLKVKTLLEKYKVERYFVFDMSVPDTIGYKNNSLKFYSRESEFENSPLFYNECEGIWLDSFFDENWFSIEHIYKHLDKNKTVAIVSPELHTRNHLSFWNKIKTNKLIDSNIILCTDLPEEAKHFFYE